MTEQPVAADPLGPLASITAGTSVRMRKALEGYALGAVTWRLAKSVYAHARTEVTYSVTVEATDDIYPDVHEWLLARLPARRRRALVARSERARYTGHGILISNDGTERPAPPLTLFYDGSRAQTVTLGPHRIRVEVEEPRTVGSADDLRSWRKPEQIRFAANGVAARDAVVEWLTGIAASKRETIKPRLYMAARWGDWLQRDELMARTLDTVILADGQAERITADLARFLTAESDYLRLGIPWHRGYLFHGPPGTGKTSLARALAALHGLNVYYLPLSDLTADTNLYALIAAIPARSLLLLEDIDVVHAAKSRDDTKDRVSLSGLLNALDGIMSPHGLVTCMTTNSVESLDGALIRPGRADCIEHLGYLTSPQFSRLVVALTGSPPGRGLPLERAVTAADVVGVIKPHIGDRAAQRRALDRWVPARMLTKETDE